MTFYEELEQYAQDQGIEVYDLRFQEVKSMAMKYGGKYSVALDLHRIPRSDERAEALAHELGHIQTHTLRSLTCAYDTAGRGEQRAWRWAIEHALPREKLESAVAACQGRVWEIAEELDLPESFIERALAHYGMFK